MSQKNRLLWTVALLSGALVVVLGVRLFVEVWHYAGEYDKNPSQRNLKNQLMRRKSDSMQDILDAIVRGRFNRVNAAAVDMERYAATIDGYLSTDVYEQHGKSFNEAIHDLKRATAQSDAELAKEAALRLERSCLECHMLINAHKGQQVQGNE
ncbi:cytochrome c [Methylicorpusculum oleiharenae]|uniref:hypothetical protein n=1 Tax=Methylicorpusculum oleiharenae TaxID=1338687 RepID=UPI0013594565|nr:hypothetical protein [Methylicorpusculum oleiharenae]MCD2453611.1 cytochrome c [Methylicorpusculum oleiharenae]